MKMYFSSEEDAALGTKYVTSDTGGGGPMSRSRWDPATPIRRTEHVGSASLLSRPLEIRTLTNNAGKYKATNKTQKDRRQQECGILSALAQTNKGGKRG